MVDLVPFRSIGPAVMSGRTVEFAVARPVSPDDPPLGTILYAATATGGVWKSTNGGASWDPITDRDLGVGAMGAVAVAPSDPNVVWVGTGEANNSRSHSYGDGVYRSTDAGQSFEHRGLRSSQHVARIVVHPTDANTVFVAAQGPLWGAGGDRGIYRTTDGGATWEAVLSVDEFTGGTDIVMDPSDPDVIYAAMLQRERRAYSYIGGGPGSGVYKSDDGGDSWTELTTGLPTGDLGRIGLDVCATLPQTVFATVEGPGEAQGSYRSDDSGETWRKTSGISSLPWYFGQIRVDPNDCETVYHLGVGLQRSEDGAVTWGGVGSGPHADQHALWINPENSHHLVLGNDGGVYVSRDRAATWDFATDLPVSQFYDVGFDMQEPYFHVYGGLQDNGTWGGPSGKRSGGIYNSDWYRVNGSDGFFAVVDPTDAAIGYFESQNGGITRRDGRSGISTSIRPPAEEGVEFRSNWSAPIHLSPFDPSTIYFAMNHVFRSADRGDTWQRTGGDLTQAIDRDALPMFGSIPGPDAVSRHQGTARFGTIAALDVSPVTPGVLITGADDGTVAISRDDGSTWTKIWNTFPGVPDTAYVSDVIASQFNDGVFYVTFDNHRSNDFRPYVMKTVDGGGTWTSLASNLPEFGGVRALVEHPRNPDLLFVGTEVGVFASIDGGGSWSRMSNGLAPVRIDDLEIHPRENSLIVATHGRGFAILDDLSFLEHLATALENPARPAVFPVEDAFVVQRGTEATAGTQGAHVFQGENAVNGADVFVLLPDRELSSVILEITSPVGVVARTIEVPLEPGLHHLVWDRFLTDPPAVEVGAGRGGRGAAGGRGGRGGGRGGAAAGPQARPGTYLARLTVVGTDGERSVLEQPFRAKRDPILDASGGV